jgi:hypothetical protein
MRELKLQFKGIFAALLLMGQHHQGYTKRLIILFSQAAHVSDPLS